MFNFKFFIAICALSLFTGAAARAATCDTVDVSVTPLSYVVRDNLSAREMLEQLLDGGAHNITASSMALGMVVAKQENSISVTEAPDGCRVFHVKVGFAPATMYLANELVDFKCGYRHVRSHEMEHVRIYSDFLAQVAGSLPQTLTAIASTGTRDDNAADIAHMYKALGVEFSKVYEQQHALDSDETYKRNAEVCKGGLVAIALAF